MADFNGDGVDDLLTIRGDNGDVFIAYGGDTGLQNVWSGRLPVGDDPNDDEDREEDMTETENEGSDDPGPSELPLAA